MYSTRYFLELKDLFVTPIFLVIIFAIAFSLRKKYTNKETRKYFIPALSIKIVGAIAVGILYQLIYKGGDTANYFLHCKVIATAFYDSPAVGIKLLFSNGEFDPETAPYTVYMQWYKAKTEFFVARVGAVFAIISYMTYSTIAVFFAAISFTGVWALYTTLLQIYPRLTKQFAIAVFFLPSVFFWGSGLLKDSLTLGALGWFFYGFYNLFIARKRIIHSALILFLGAYVLASVKIYILLCVLPPALFWAFNEFSTQIKNKTIRIVAKPVFIILGAVVAYFGAINITEGDAKYDIEKIGETTKITSKYLSEQVESGSQYNIGELDGSIGSMLAVAPQAIFISLFRPFLWESRNPTMLLSALEAMFFLVLTIRQISKVGIGRVLGMITSVPIINFCIIFSLLFAFAVGLNSGNFGTLVRYKIPLMPFYLSAIYIMEENIKVSRKYKRVASSRKLRQELKQI